MPGAADRGGAPPLRRLERRDTHRLIPSKYSAGGDSASDSVLVRIADSDAHLAEIFDLDGATNDRLLAENERLPGIGAHELVFGVPHFRIVNAAFTHAHPLGSRFNGPERGAWYAGFEVETSQAEVAFHKTVALAEIGWPDDSITYDEYLADFNADFHDLRARAQDAGRRRAFEAFLDPGSYVRSQALAASLLPEGSLGLVYPSVRRAGGTCLACFRPALVTNVRKGRTWRFTWEKGARPRIERVRRQRAI
jgi:hypothetical protein